MVLYSQLDSRKVLENLVNPTFACGPCVQLVIMWSIGRLVTSRLVSSLLVSALTLPSVHFFGEVSGDTDSDDESI